MDQIKHYYAFISHDTDDRRKAFWLRRKLEGYHIPTSVQDKAYPQYKGVKRLKPCFVYQTDLAGNNLDEALRRELDDSQYLIVICSPSTPGSEYVNKEVRHFVKEGLAEKIIPYIVKGTAEESFPAAIKELAEGKLYDPETNTYKKVEKVELRGIHDPQTRKDLKSRMAPVVNVVATMLGLRFDTLWDRFKRKRRMTVAAMACAASICLLAGLFFWDYYRPTYEYYVDYVDKWGKPEGLFKLTKEQVKNRMHSYQFEKRRTPFGEPNEYEWRLSKVTLINSSFRPIDHSELERKERPSIQKIEYFRQDTTVKSVSYCDTKGKVLMRYEFSELDGITAAVADLRNGQEQFGSGYVAANVAGLTSQLAGNGQNKSSIIRYAYQRDKNGHIISQTYHLSNYYKLNETLICDSDGIFGNRFTLDSLGRCIAVEYIGKDGEKVCTKRGIAGRRYEYDEKGNLFKTIYVDLDGNPTMNELFYAICVDDYDEYGNVIKESMFDAHNKPCVCSLGWSTIRTKVERGNCVSVSFFDVEDVLSPNNEGVAQHTMVYDKHGNVKEIRNLWTDGSLCLDSKHGIAIQRGKFDSRGNRIMASFFDTFDKPCFAKEGFAKYTQKFDKDNNCIEMSFFDIDGKPCFNKEGWAKTTLIYNKGYMVEQAYFGIDDNPCLSLLGYSKSRIAYDNSGNPKEYRYYDTNDELCITKEGIAGYTKLYDAQGNLTEQACYGIDGKPCMNVYGNAKVTLVFERGNPIEQAFYDINGNPCIGKGGFAKQISKYDEQGNLLEESFYDAKGNPCLVPQGFARRTAKYEEGKPWPVEEACYGVDGNPCLSNLGFARGESKYDSKGNKVEERYFDVDGKPCLDYTGCAGKKVEYDERGNRVKESYLNRRGDVDYWDDGYAYMTSKYDSKGNLVERAFYDPDGNLCLSNLFGAARITTSYDPMGNPIEMFFFGEDNEPCISKEGVARKEVKYDRFGQLIEETCFNINNDTCMSNYGYARKTIRYDSRGNVVEQAFYDADGNLYAANMDFAIWRIEYDYLGKKTVETFYGTDEKPCLGNQGFARVTYQYDVRGNLTEINYYDEFMRPTLNNCLVAKEVYGYDENNNCIGVSYYRKDGGPALWCNQFSSIENDFDDKHRRIKTKRYDMVGELVSSDSIVYNQFSLPSYVYTCDKKGNKAEVIPVLQVILDVKRHDPNNPQPDNAYIILEWENWNITDHLSQYVNMLIQSRMGQPKRLVVINEMWEPELLYVDSNAIITNTGLTEEQYELACDLYEYEWLNDWKSNY